MLLVTAVPPWAFWRRPGARGARGGLAVSYAAAAMLALLLLAVVPPGVVVVLLVLAAGGVVGGLALLTLVALGGAAAVVLLATNRRLGQGLWSNPARAALVSTIAWVLAPPTAAVGYIVVATVVSPS